MISRRKTRPAARIVTLRHDATDIPYGHFARLPSSLGHTVSGHARRSAGRHSQRPDPPEHRPEQPPRDNRDSASRASSKGV